MGLTKLIRLLASNRMSTAVAVDELLEGRGHRPKREPKKRRGPKWVRPSTKEEKGEINFQAKLLGVHRKRLTTAIKKAPLKTLGKKAQAHLSNTDVGYVKGKKAFHKMGRDYTRQTGKVAHGMSAKQVKRGSKRTKMPAPMVVKTKKHPKGYLVGGNTRLVGADVKNRPVRAVVADLRKRKK